MRVTVVGKSFGRMEGGRLVRHPVGSEIDVSDRTLAAFPHRFQRSASVATDVDERARLIELAEAFEVEIDKRWSTERIRAAVEGVGGDGGNGG